MLLRAGMAGPESGRTSERVRANMSRVVEKRDQAGRPPYGPIPIREVVEVVNGKLQTRRQDLALWTEEQRTRAPRQSGCQGRLSLSWRILKVWM